MREAIEAEFAPMSEAEVREWPLLELVTEDGLTFRYGNACTLEHDEDGVTIRSFGVEMHVPSEAIDSLTLSGDDPN